MSLTTLLSIYIIIGIIALITIFLGIINWINLASTSSAINELQMEVEKKNLEFDSLRKKSIKSSSYAPSPAPVAFQGTDGNLPQPQIEIVRNVRKGLAPGQSHLKQETVPMGKDYSPDFAETLQRNDTQHPMDIQAQVQQYENTDTGSIADINKEDVLDVVEEQETNTAIQHTEDKSITIPLYSQSGKDADFNTLWKTLTEALNTINHLHVNIDFKDILFLYDKEIEYLHKIHQVVEMQQGTISFINCGSELTSVLYKDKTLSNLIKEA